MVKAFSKIFRMSMTDGALVQVAFYDGYFAMVFSAATFIRRYSYKAGVLVGLGLYAAGALLFFPAKAVGVRLFLGGLLDHDLRTVVPRNELQPLPEHGNGGDRSRQLHFVSTLKRIFSLPRYREGVIAQFFYVGAQIIC